MLKLSGVDQVDSFNDNTIVLSTNKGRLSIKGEGLNVSKSWKLSSLMTALERLAAKGFVVCDRSTRTNYYSAIIAKEEYQTAESKFFLERIFSNSVQKLVANLYDGEAISKEDLASLKQWIEEVEQKEGE